MNELIAELLVFVKTAKCLASIAIFLNIFFCQKNDSSKYISSAEVKVRALKDTVGFSFKKDQIKSVIETAEKLEAQLIEQHKKTFGDKKWRAGICPHDDHLLAARVYVHLFQNLSAKRYVILGVAHQAQKWGAHDCLIFDSFDYWQAPARPIKVSDLRNQMLILLSKQHCVINNDWQSEEHSVEGIIPFIQYYRPEAEIVSILVPSMNWERINELSESFAAALSQLMKKFHWTLGEDIAFICSNDGDHYGDEDWGGRNFAPFGVDEKGYELATRQDKQLINFTLTGTLTSEKLRDFCFRVWSENNLLEYKIRWCGRFAIPFGLSTVLKLSEKLESNLVSGYLLRYDTSSKLGKLPLEKIGIGTTAPNNIHHWVGYSAIGYR